MTSMDPLFANEASGVEQHHQHFIHSTSFFDNFSNIISSPQPPPPPMPGGAGDVDTALIRASMRWGSVALGAFMVWGAVGNALVCIAIFTDRRLQNVTNYFLFSLAICDLLVSLLVMPFSILTELNNGIWRYGFTLCASYSYADVFLCSASIVHMSVISLDRYLGISRPLKTRNKSKFVVTFKIIIVWVITTMISCPIAILALLVPNDIYRNGTCAIYNPYFLIYGSTLAFLIPCLIMVATYVRTTQLLRQQAILCGGYTSGGGSGRGGVGGAGSGGGPGGGGVNDNSEGLRRTQTRPRRSTKLISSVPNAQRQNTVDSSNEDGYTIRGNVSYTLTNSPSLASGAANELVHHHHHQTHRKSTSASSQSRHYYSPMNRNNNSPPYAIMGGAEPKRFGESSAAHLQMLLPTSTIPNAQNRPTTTNLDFFEKESNPVELMNSSMLYGSSTEEYASSPSPAVIAPSTMETFRNKVKERTMTFWNKTARRTASASEVANEQKATRVLGLVFVCFCVCWTPFFAHNFTVAFCGDHCEIPGWLATVFLWLGYISSTINPIIYTTFNKRFREAFTNILCCRCRGGGVPAAGHHSTGAGVQKRLSRASASSFHSVTGHYGYGAGTGAGTGHNFYGQQQQQVVQQTGGGIGSSAAALVAQVYAKCNNNNSKDTKAIVGIDTPLQSPVAAIEDDDSSPTSMLC